jgi:hypothetical protein
MYERRDTSECQQVKSGLAIALFETAAATSEASR